MPDERDCLASICCDGGEDSGGFINYTSAVDENLFFGFNRFSSRPPLGGFFNEPEAQWTCFSAVSQQEADWCAIRGAQQAVWRTGFGQGTAPYPLPANFCSLHPTHPWCVNPAPANPGRPSQQVPFTFFTNDAQTGSYTCPNGVVEHFTIPAGTVQAVTKALANAEALSQADTAAKLLATCIPIPTPLAWFKFEGNTQDAVSGGAWDLSFASGLGGFETYVAGVVSQALQNNLGGATSRGSPYTTQAIYNGTAFSVVFWFKIIAYDADTTAAVSYNKFFGNPNAWVKWIAGTSTLLLEVGTTLTVSLPFAPAIGGWHFIAYTYSAATGKCGLRIDGTPLTESVGTETIPNDGSEPEIFLNLINSSHVPAQTCNFDEFGIFNVALTDAQLDYLYNAGAGRTYPF